MICGIYRIVNIVTNRTYIGSSVRIMKRWKAHLWALRHGGHSNTRLQASWIKYGEQAFAFEALVECDEGKLEQREQNFIDAYIQHDMPLYNLKPSADSRLSFRYRATEETKLKQRAAFKGKSTAPLTSETKYKISSALRGRVFTPEHKARIAAAKIARPYKHSDGTRMKIGQANKGKKSRLGAVLTEETRMKISAARIRSAQEKRNLKTDRQWPLFPSAELPTRQL